MNFRKLTTLVLAAGSLAAWAGQPQRLNVEAGAFHPVLSPDGSVLLYSTVDHTGLKALDLADGSVTVIDEAPSAGFQPVFSADGSTVFYRTATMVDGLLCRDLRSYDFCTGGSTLLAKPSRRNDNMNAIADQKTYACSDFTEIEVCLDGRVTRVSPVADAHSYLWASLSSDASRLAFSEPFQGVFISKADGSEARRVLEKGDYVSWAGPSTVIAVVSHDDGYVILDSRLVAVNINTGITRLLTPEDVKVSEATASPSGLVVYSDLDGNLFTLDINAQ